MNLTGGYTWQAQGAKDAQASLWRFSFRCSYRRENRPNDYLPTTMTTKVPGRTGGRGRGFSGVAAGRGPNSAATR